MFKVAIRHHASDQQEIIECASIMTRVNPLTPQIYSVLEIYDNAGKSYITCILVDKPFNIVPDKDIKVFFWIESK
jgi:hypothetical protein